MFKTECSGLIVMNVNVFGRTSFLISVLDCSYCRGGVGDGDCPVSCSVYLVLSCQCICACCACYHHNHKYECLSGLFVCVCVCVFLCTGNQCFVLPQVRDADHTQRYIYIIHVQISNSSLLSSPCFLYTCMY